MSDAGTMRRPPEIVFVPPSDRPLIPLRLIVLVVGVQLLFGVAIAVGATGGGIPGSMRVLAGGAAMFAIGILSGALMWKKNRSHRAQRRRFIEQHPLDESDSLAQALATTWKQAGRLPKLKEVQNVLRAEASPGESRARIIYFGEAEVPEVGELHFEPEIVTPTGALGKKLFWLLFALVLSGVFVLDYLGLLPPPLRGIRHFAGGFGYFVVMGLVVLAMWIWRSMIRPTYVRMAPGVIQVLEYRYSKSKPTIRGYPMETGTLALFVRMGRHAVLTLARDDMKDVIAFSRMRRSKELIQRAWQALLSTAPTPPLSEEELVG